MPATLEPSTSARVRYAGDQEFPEGEFVNLRDVPVFAEHSTRAKDGRPLKFTRTELEAVAERCNRRITETGDYAAITIGHTPDPDQVAAGTAKQPDLVGLAGPFKVGLIGPPGKQRYAVLADFHVYAEHFPKVKQHPRRSPELWLEDRYEEMFLDPIALLGAEAPRLDMGLLYSANRQGRKVERYAAVASATSGFVPTDRYAGKQCYDAIDATGSATTTPATGAMGRMARYEAGDDATGKPSESGDSPGNMQIGPDDVRAIVDALEQLDWVQWVKGQMQEESGGMGSVPEAGLDALGGDPGMLADAPGGDLPGALGGDMPGGDAPMLADAPGGDAPAGPPSGGPPAPPPKEKNMAGSPAPQEYAAGNVMGSASPAGSGNVDGGPSRVSGSYDKTPGKGGGREAYAKLAGEVQRLRQELTDERSRRINGERSGKLRDLAERFDFDLPKEVERVKYGRMNDDQFAEHCANIEENYRPTLLGVDLPTFGDAMLDAPGRPGGSSVREKYSKQQSERAFQIAKDASSRGHHEEGLFERCLREVSAGRERELVADLAKNNGKA